MKKLTLLLTLLFLATSAFASSEIVYNEETVSQNVSTKEGVLVLIAEPGALVIHEGTTTTIGDNVIKKITNTIKVEEGDTMVTAEGEEFEVLPYFLDACNIDYDVIKTQIAAYKALQSIQPEEEL